MSSTVLSALIDQIRPSVRNLSPYVVGNEHIDPEVKLNQNESPFDLPESLKEELLHSFLSIPFNRYPKEQPLNLKQKLGEYLNYTPEGILVGNGSNELTYTLGLCLIDDGTSVVLPTPMFSLYEKVVLLHGGVPVLVPPKSNLHFDIDRILSEVKTHTPPLTIIASPNNPTGLSVSIEDIERILSATDGFLVVDEAYIEFTETDGTFNLLSSYPNLIILRTFSKAYGLAGLRIGYMLAHPYVIRELMKSRVPFGVDPLAETVALSLLEKPEIVAHCVEHIKRERDLLYAQLDSIPEIHPIPSQANFVIFKTPQKPANLMKNLAREGVLVRNMEGYSELAGYLRVNAGSLEENKVFLSALEKTLRK